MVITPAPVTLAKFGAIDQEGRAHYNYMRPACLFALGLLGCGGCTNATDNGAGSTGDTGSSSSEASGTTLSDGTTSETTADETGPDSSEATGPMSQCGDAVVDPGEQCDDGNEVNADGCNRDCVESGSIVWEQTVVFAGRLIAVGPDDSIHIGALLSQPSGALPDAAAVFSHVSVDGQLLGEDAIEGPVPPADGHASGAIVSLNVDSAGRRAASIVWAVFDAQGDILRTIERVDVANAWFVQDAGVGSFAFDISTDDSLFGVVSHDDTRYLRRYDSRGAIEFEDVIDSEAPDLVLDSGDGGLAIVRAGVRRIDADGVDQWTSELPLGGRPWGIGRMLDGGFVLAGLDGPILGPNTGWITPLDAEGTVGISVQWPDAPTDDVWVSDIATDLEGNIVVASTPGLRKYGPDFELLWSREIDEPILPVLVIDSGGAIVVLNGTSTQPANQPNVTKYAP